ncbi:unnamed protein product [Cuscuta campestris]|uniref:Uncharacterized protein n=1 Tax=Cuscuta campestris TaxID=132261 RepID=A0A484L4K8_9ASTE|nr:unnamed protein product [Cuscuta campestris]
MATRRTREVIRWCQRVGDSGGKESPAVGPFDGEGVAAAGAIEGEGAAAVGAFGGEGTAASGAIEGRMSLGLRLLSFSAASVGD